MSTRCQIGFYETNNTNLLKPNALLYRHQDGYPNGVLPDLVPFLKLFNKRRGLDDCEYAAAWTLHHLINLRVQWAKDRHKKSPNSTLPEDGLECTNYGVSQELHGDIAYYYAVNSLPNKLQVYKVNDDNFDLIQTVELENTTKG